MPNNLNDNTTTNASEIIAPNIDKVKESLQRLIIDGEHPIVVALNGGWGEGKTYFWKNNINSYPEKKLAMFLYLAQPQCVKSNNALLLKQYLVQRRTGKK